ncbi:MAG: CDP-glucose 4,6-dehydratase [Verrucomicrobia bacterium]|jgi:CDP-glucose 4,6-dehydratase|nr:CDP-glucose 4,6-dehydratase [Verrucomicrobiota bacterium]
MDPLSGLGPAFAGKRVFLTGHTGFKGAWLAEWLLALGAEVHGYALPPEEGALFQLLGLEDRMASRYADLRDPGALRRALAAAKPDFVFHLAAQPIVLDSYEDPAATFAINVTGTIHLLEALREIDHPCAAVLVSSDKCYRNDGRGRPFRETDPLGGEDPYSASKAAMEIAVHSWRVSFFRDHPVRLATARAGNVIGGGDFAVHRIVPDCVRALRTNQPIEVRNPGHTRPWQHVLEPLGGYLILAAALAAGWQDPDDLYAFNFGPADENKRRVGDLVDAILAAWPGEWRRGQPASIQKEARLLDLSIERAQALLRWHPRWNFPETVARTVQWYRAVLENPPIAREQTLADLTAYTEAARE